MGPVLWALRSVGVRGALPSLPFPLSVHRIETPGQAPLRTRGVRSRKKDTFPDPKSDNSAEVAKNAAKPCPSQEAGVTVLTHETQRSQ